jgi:hypothetical protein
MLLVLMILMVTPREKVLINGNADTELTSIIQKIKNESNGRPIRVGVVGVWTEAKVPNFPAKI